MSSSLPGYDNRTVDVRLLAEVDHPDGGLDVVVVHDGAVWKCCVRLAVDRQRRVTVPPLLPDVGVIKPLITSSSLTINTVV